MKEITDVSIKQLAIEVKVIKIGNRQVTLAVFRQLQAEYIIDPDTGELRGVPWGRVNYHVGCENTDPYAPQISKKHLHIVWQKGGELRRAIACPPRYGSILSDDFTQVNRSLRRYGLAYIASRILEGWVPEREHPHLPEVPLPFTINLPDYQVHIDYIPEEIRGAWCMNSDGTIEVYHTDELQSLIDESEVPIDSRKIAEDFLIPYAKRRERFERMKDQTALNWEQSYFQLEQLDQLFIAV